MCSLCLQRLKYCITPLNHPKSTLVNPLNPDCKNVRLSSLNSITYENNRQLANDTVYV